MENVGVALTLEIVTLGVPPPAVVPPVHPVDMYWKPLNVPQAHSELCNASTCWAPLSTAAVLIAFGASSILVTVTPVTAEEDEEEDEDADEEPGELELPLAVGSV